MVAIQYDSSIDGRGAFMSPPARDSVRGCAPTSGYEEEADSTRRLRSVTFPRAGASGSAYVERDRHTPSY
ncbi:hypothetical protein GCM10010252_64710 [Streptomyces aureoverticillatus]|nr:hypothetical protein GCM10010252_64710 [Streptomyces aureoverticillatus]